jgi:hypothetical protein
VPAPGVVALYDLADLAAADAARLVERRPEQIVFAHAAPWTADSPIAPELVTLLYQSIVPPWTDDRSDDELVDELVSGPRFDADELAADDPARFASLVERVWPAGPGPRSRLWAGGPVASNRFD